MAKLVKRLFCIICIAVSMGSATLAAEGDAERLIGIWREIGRTETIVEFKKNGEVIAIFRGRDPERLKGTWRLRPNGDVSMTFTYLGHSMTQKGTLHFDGEEMVLIDDTGEKTRHRRHTDPVPELAR